MRFLPVKEHFSENADFLRNALCKDTLQECVDFYRQGGYSPPWICYYAKEKGRIVGAAAFKGRPRAGRVEIAYRVFPTFQNRGIGSRIANLLVKVALQHDSDLVIVARTLPEESYSVRLLRENGFYCCGSVEDADDGLLWEWVYRPV